MRILIFGDSITYGYNDAKGGWAERLRMDPDFLSLDYTVFPLGIPGDTSEGVLARFEIETKARFREEPSFIVLAIGTNDTQYLYAENRYKYTDEDFEHTYKELLRLSKEYGAGTLVLGIPPVDESRVNPMPWSPEKSYHDKKVRECNTKILTWAQEQSFAYVDVMKVFEENGGVKLLDDGVHPDTNGHELMYREVKKQLLSVLKG